MILLLILLFGFESIGGVYATTTETYFARVTQNGCYLYINPINVEDYSNIYFELPKSYFVELLSSYNEQFYFAKYLDINGYVKKEQVKAIMGTPSKAYLNNVSFRVYAELSRDLRSEPCNTNGTNAQVCYIPLYTKNLTFYGKIRGISLIDGRTDIWYYCKYTADKEYYGYVYSDFCDNGAGKEISIPLNTEEVVYISNPTFGENHKEITAIPVESKTTWLIIAVLTLPVLVFILLLLKGSKLVKREKTATKKEVCDY